MAGNILEKLFAKLLGKGELIAHKNGIMVFKNTADDGMITIQSFKNFKPLKTVTKKTIGDMTDGMHIYNDTKHVFTNVKNFATKTETNIVSTKYHALKNRTFGDHSPKEFISDVQSIKTLPDGKQIKHRVVNMLDNIKLYKEGINGKKRVTIYNKKQNGNIGTLSSSMPYSQNTISSRFLNNLYNI